MKFENLLLTLRNKQLKKNQQSTYLENQLKILEKCLDKDDNLSKYNVIKNDNQMQFMIILQKVFVLEANANGLNILKNQQNSF